jgi:hypothetical protein
MPTIPSMGERIEAYSTLSFAGVDGSLVVFDRRLESGGLV